MKSRLFWASWMFHLGRWKSRVLWNSRSSNSVVVWTSNKGRSVVLNKLLRDVFALWLSVFARDGIREGGPVSTICAHAGPCISSMLLYLRCRKKTRREYVKFVGWDLEADD